MYSSIRKNYSTLLYPKMKLITLIASLLLFGSATLFAQMSFSEIELGSIPYPKVRSFIHNQQSNSKLDKIAELKPSCENLGDFGGFRTYEKKFKVKGDLNSVWTSYISASPTHLWKTRKSAVGLIYDRKKDRVSYSSDTCSGSRIGQVLYLDLRLIKGFYHLATALEITNIQSETSTIEINYVESGINEGKQWIRMADDGNGNTIITHISSIKSNSPFRDKILYPYFHNKLINAVHRKMKKLLKNTVYESSLEYAID